MTQSCTRISQYKPRNSHIISTDTATNKALLRLRFFLSATVNSFILILTMHAMGEDRRRYLNIIIRRNRDVTFSNAKKEGTQSSKETATVDLSHELNSFYPYFFFILFSICSAENFIRCDWFSLKF